MVYSVCFLLKGCSKSTMISRTFVYTSYHSNSFIFIPYFDISFIYVQEHQNTLMVPFSAREIVQCYAV